jgi:hypothetical protein
MFIGSWLLALSTEHGAQCLMYGDYYQDCHKPSGDLLHGLFLASVTAGLVALLLPRGRAAAARATAVLFQWSAQTALVVAVLRYGS